MTGEETLTALAKSKLNITWDDAGTDARVAAILEESLPSVAAMIALTYEDGDAHESDGSVFDFSQPSMERNLLMNHIAYEWNHEADLFWDAYKEEIAACRKHRAVEDEEDGEGE